MEWEQEQVWQQAKNIRRHCQSFDTSMTDFISGGKSEGVSSVELNN